MTINPYRGLPSDQYWRTGVSDIGLGQFDPVISTKFSIMKSDQIATLGSCFAQHLARHIHRSGYNYLIAEPLRPEEEITEQSSLMASQFSARYGNVYTVRQALQLLERAFDGWEPHESTWERNGRYFDPFRPNVYAGGFEHLSDLEIARQRHLAAVRRVFTESDIIVFTLGLTETWESTADGAVFPVAPGVTAGSFDAAQHSFKNFKYSEVASDLTKWCQTLKELNPRVRILLTVSPVPLNATFEMKNVWAATTYSKSVLRAAAGDISSDLTYVDYFPSYEIITSPLNQGRYFADDMREVTELGVQHVMKVFGRHYLADESGVISEPLDTQSAVTSTNRSRQAAQVFCDEELLDQE